MRYPDFIAEMGLEANRPKLRFGVWSGYGQVIAFTALAMLGGATGVVPWLWQFYLLVAIKLATNTLALVSLRRRWLVLELQGLNTFADVLVMTGAIYFTGGQISPLFPIYLLEISLIALLTNVGVTLLTVGIVLLCYTTMAVAVHAGVLPTFPAPIETSAGLTTAHVVVQLLFAAFVILAPTLYTSRILTILRRKEQDLERRSAELVEAGKQKSQFMANITHELRTPIHGICGLAELVDSGVYGPVTDKQKAASESIKRSALGLLGLIDDLLALSKADAGKLELKVTEVDIVAAIDAVAASVRWMSGTKKISLYLDVPPELPVIETDRGKLGQILVNLIANAIKFSPEGGTVTVQARRLPARRGRTADGDGVTITIEDRGVGIPADELASIFDEFRQVDGSTERTYGGVGLGLALVKRLTNLLGGQVTVTSEVGVGSAFTVILPMRTPAAFKERGRDSVPPPARPGDDAASYARPRRSSRGADP